MVPARIGGSEPLLADQVRGESVPGAPGVGRLVDRRGRDWVAVLTGGPGEAVLGAGEVDVDADLGEVGSLRRRRPGLAAVGGGVEGALERVLASPATSTPCVGLKNVICGYWTPAGSAIRSQVRPRSRVTSRAGAPGSGSTVTKPAPPTNCGPVTKHAPPAQVVAGSGSDWSLQLVPPSWLTSRALVRPALHVLAIHPVVAVGKFSPALSHSVGIRPESCGASDGRSGLRRASGGQRPVLAAVRGPVEPDLVLVPFRRRPRRA